MIWVGGMEHQLRILREIKAGNIPNTPENLLKAFNAEILTERAVDNQRRTVNATKSAIQDEIKRLQHLVAERQASIDRLSSYFEVDARDPQNDIESKVNSSRNSPVDPDLMAKIYEICDHLANACEGKVNVGSSGEFRKVLIQLIKCSLDNEVMLMPKKLPAVQFLIGEGLVKVVPSDGIDVALRLY